MPRPGTHTTDLRSLKKAFRKMERAGIDTRKVWRKVKTPLRKDQAEHIKDQKDSDGATWKPLAVGTRDKRLSKGGKAGKFTKRGKLKKSAERKLGRVLSRRLVSGAKVRITRRSISIRSKVRWAGIHQHGGRAGRGAMIPKREFMYVSEELQIKATALLAIHIAEAFNTGG